MDDLRFATPVLVIVGFGLPSTIGSVREAYELLDDWPPSQRRDRGEHKVALTACRAALNGEIDPETARAAFFEFARRDDLMVPDGERSLVPQLAGNRVHSRMISPTHASVY